MSNDSSLYGDTEVLDDPEWEIRRGEAVREKSKRLDESRKSLRHFAVHVQRDYEDVHHTRILCSELQDWAFGDVPRLMLWAPPQTSKSQHSSRLLPAFILGVNPNARILIVSYGADLAESFGQDIQSFIESSEYQSLFPNTKLASGSDKERRTKSKFDIVGFRGGVECVGRGGSITGKGFDYIILDDTIKDMAEAESPTYRETTYNFYRGTLRTRRKSHRTRILMLNTRWHRDDLNGRVLADAKANPKADQWKVVNLKMALSDYAPEEQAANAWKYAPGQEPGKEVLWPERFPFDDVETTRASNGSYVYSAQYAGDPTSREGNAVKRHWFEDGSATKYCMFFDPADIVAVTLRYDVAFSDSPDSDWTWGSLKAKKKDGSLLTLWQHFGHWSNQNRRTSIATFGEQCDAMMKGMFPNLKWTLGLEAGIGPGVDVVAEDIKHLCSVGLPAKAIPVSNVAKAVRANSWLTSCENKLTKLYAGNQLLDFGMIDGINQWINPFLEKALILKFSDDGLRFIGGKDDMIDAEDSSHDALTAPKRTAAGYSPVVMRAKA